jgi:hypothetical protein
MERKGVDARHLAAHDGICFHAKRPPRETRAISRGGAALCLNLGRREILVFASREA